MPRLRQVLLGMGEATGPIRETRPHTMDTLQQGLRTGSQTQKRVNFAKIETFGLKRNPFCFFGFLKWKARSDFKVVPKLPSEQFIPL